MNEIKNELTEYAERFTSDESAVLRDLREHCYAHYEDSSMLSDSSRAGCSRCSRG
jgi:hypothetical protein